MLTSRLSEQRCWCWGGAEGWSPAQGCSMPWHCPAGWLARPAQAVAVEDGGHTPLLHQCQASDSICCNKSEISPACAWLPVLGEYAVLHVLSSEQDKTRAGKDEQGCGCSLGKPGCFPGRLKPPLSLISKDARSGLAQQKEARDCSSWFFQHGSPESGVSAAAL